MGNFEPSRKLSELAEFCREKYNRADLAQHNWDHIVRNIYRAEEIAETEEDVNMEVLYAATMLHDIGVTIGEYKDHDKNSRKIAREKLPSLGFTEEETKKVVEVLQQFASGNCDYIEAKILSDADKLEKSSIVSIGNAFKIAEEFNREVHEMLQDLSRYRDWKKEGFYTEKAREINDDGIQERIRLMEKMRQKFSEREDFTASEKDLKLEI